MRILQILRSERGATTVLIVGVYLILLAFVGMATDFGIILRYRRAMQNACDAGALAGALDLRLNPTAAVPTAQRYARNDMVPNRISWTSLEGTLYDKNWQPTLIGPRIIRVEIHADVPTFFLRIVEDSVPVAVDCAAKLMPIILTNGLVPMGLNYNEWDDYYNSDCWQYVTDGIPFADRPAHCLDIDITVDVSDKDNPWGSGNTGLLSMGCFDCPAGGGSQWKDYFINGAPTAYCYDPDRTADVSDHTMDGAYCANVKTEPGAKIGPIRQGIDERCASTNTLDHVIMMPLLNPAYMESGSGTYTTEIWGFVAFEIDCTKTNFTGGDPTIEGGFVSIVSMQAVGVETEFDTGVYTVKLIK
ncbi:MAG: TadE/TadG family type IV pilus assembly protein [bacterium]